ncbi:MAG: carboxypeptidase regulatory-like domain-containing protein, partial [Acidobacteriota bacterium]
MRSKLWVTVAVVGVLAILLGLTTQAQVVKKTQGGLDDLTMVSGRVRVPQTVVPVEQLRMEESATAAPGQRILIEGWDRFLSENGTAWSLAIDRRTGYPSLAQGSGVPWVPGRGNALQLGDLRESLGANDTVTQGTLVRLATQFMHQYPELFGVAPQDLRENPVSTGEYGGYLWYVQFDRTYHGIPVERSYVVFRVNNGNLVQFGGEYLGPIDLDPLPSIDAETAQQILAGYAGGLDASDEWVNRGSLSILPLAPSGDDGVYKGQTGHGVEYHLVYTLAFRRAGMMGTWTAKVDAHTGEVLQFVDANDYGSIKGGIYITSNLDTEVVRPMPFANSATSTYANAAGVYSQTSGTVTTTLAGKYVKVTDSCGSISLSGTAPADLNLGTSSGTDCTTPGVGGAGNTHAARTTYLHLTLWKEKAMAWLPSNTWLTGQVGDKVNLNQTCNAYWDGSAVNFFKSGGGCSNTGELPTVFLHEIGHGLDDNDGSPSSTVGSSESYGDLNGILATHNSCLGLNFIPGQNCSGYGNPCTSCTGIRDADYAKHTYSTSPATPAQLAATSGFHCSRDSSYPGPCGYEGHCESYIMSEVGWDLAARDLPSAGFDANTSWFIADRLFYLTRPTSGDSYSCPSVTTANGCGTSNWFQTYLVADDDNGNLSDGTPHAAAIYAAFNRHAIACSTTVHTNSSTCGTMGQPTLTAAAGSGSVSLSWTAVSGASKYLVLRNEMGSSAGMMILATVTSGTGYTDSVVATGVTYYYSVLGVGSSSSCFGALSAVQSATPTAGATYSITGTVSGATASGVTISLTGAAIASTTTDTSGNYTFSGLANGSYTVTPSKSGYTFSPASIAVTISGANQTGKNFTATAVPTYSISGTVSGDIASGVTMGLTGAATGTTTTDASGNYTFSGLVNGSYTVAPSKSGYTFSPTSIAVTISSASQTGKNFTSTASACGAVTAVYSSTYHCPTCDTAGLSCAAPTSLLQCRGTTGESNAPNTLDGCADGNSGSCHSDESIEAITIASADGASCLNPGVQVTVTVTAYCYNTTDYVTLFYSTSAPGPSWSKVGSTQQASGSGTKTFTWTFTLAGTAGSMQAVRAQMTYNSDPGSTACLSGSYNDRDDLAFAVGGSAPATYSISGTVSGATASGVTMSLTGAATATTTTDTSGNYTFSGLANGSYTVTPSKSGYTFSPTSLAVTISGANQTGKNFTATSTATYSISGTVSGDTASGVTVNLTGAASATTTTDTSGNYTFSGLANGSYTVTPSKSGYTFSPTSLAVTISGANQTGKNFTATSTATYSILGTVSGDTASGVTMSLTGAATATTTTAADGTYTFSGLANGSYTVTPSKSGYTFSPASIAVTISGANQTGKNFTATVNPSGDTPLTSGVGVSTGSIAQGAWKYYTIAVPSGATNLSITLTSLSADLDLYVNNSTTHPTTSSYYGRSWNSGTTSESLAYTSPTVATWCIGVYAYAAGSATVTATVTTGTATYSISGTVTLSTGGGLSGVTLSTTGATATTDGSGNYTLGGLANGTYTVTPSLSGYTFSPASLSVTISGANQ